MTVSFFLRDARTVEVTVVRSNGNFGAALNQTLHFADGQELLTLTLSLLDDSHYEGGETCFLVKT